MPPTSMAPGCKQEEEPAHVLVVAVLFEVYRLLQGKQLTVPSTEPTVRVWTTQKASQPS